MKKVIFLILPISISFGENINEQILKKLDKIDNEVKVIKKEMNLIKQEMRIRFEATDKRFEMMQKNMDERFEAMDKRFEMMQKNMDERFEAMNKRFEILTDLIMALTAGIFALIGFMMWDRRTVVEKAKKECMDEVKEKADKEYVDRLLKAMNELIVLKDEKAMDIFKKYNLL